MTFIKRIFQKQIDEEVHFQFTKFGKGKYENKAILNIKKKKELQIKSSFEFVSDIIRIISENIHENAKVNGTIIAFREFKLDFDAKYSKRGNVYKAEFEEQDFSPDQLTKIYDEFKYAYLFLNIDSAGFKLKCKQSLPKPGSTLKDNFCSAKLPLEVLEEFTWDVEEDFEEASIKHEYIIEEIIIPKEYQDDPKLARLHAKRKGKLIRYLTVDGHERKEEIVFEA